MVFLGPFLFIFCFSRGLGTRIHTGRLRGRRGVLCWPRMDPEPLCHLADCPQGTQRGPHCITHLSLRTGSGNCRDPSYPCSSASPGEQCHCASGDREGPWAQRKAEGKASQSHREAVPTRPTAGRANLSASQACSAGPRMSKTLTSMLGLGQLCPL